MFIVTWVFDKLGYMPKIDMQVGKVNLDVKPPEFKMWNFPVEEKKKPVAKKATTVVKKATTVAKKVAKVKAK
jgi:hypothetical protein